MWAATPAARRALLGLSSSCRRQWAASARCASTSAPAGAAEAPRTSPAKRYFDDVDVRPLSSFLTDTFGRQHTYLRISLSERCNLRCVYCMPEEGVELTPEPSLLTSDEIVRLATLFASHGVNKIRLTGGEPLVRRDIIELTERLGRIPQIDSLGITTNAIALQRKLPSLKSAGVNGLNISLDTFKDFKFKIMTRRNGLERVLNAIDAALEHGFPVKVNCVVMRGVNDDELLDFVEFTRDKPVGVRFIEYMPFDGNKWNSNKIVSYKDMLEMVKSKYTLERLDQDPHDTSKPWQVPGYAGTVGFITSMTDNFCAGCNRLRLTADGNLKVCLFGASEVSLRDAMRSGMSDDELSQVIGAAVSRKKKQHAGMFNLAKMPNRPMILIGG